MKVLIIGGGGMLGHKLVQMWQDKFDVWATVKSERSKYEEFGIFDWRKTLENVNVENISAVEKAIDRIKPEVVVNAVGIVKQVPAAEDVIKSLTVNSIFPHRLTGLAKQYRFRLITIGTDCVFSGSRGNYIETDVPDATDLYGRSKNLGEITAKNCLTIRTSIIGRELTDAHSLVEWFLSRRGGSVKGYLNAVFSGFPTIVLAEIIAGTMENHPHLSGLYHVSSEPINKYDLLGLINKEYETNIEIEPFEDYKIDRSLDSTKFREATGFEPESWREMIKKMAADNSVYQKLQEV
ncbi:MAG: dTDP-4-dehydrorhamnose reductase family protein [Pyrinomonadaceae bacterium]